MSTWGKTPIKMIEETGKPSAWFEITYLQVTQAIVL